MVQFHFVCSNFSQSVFAIYFLWFSEISSSIVRSLYVCIQPFNHYLRYFLVIPCEFNTIIYQNISQVMKFGLQIETENWWRLKFLGTDANTHRLILNSGQWLIQKGCMGGGGGKTNS